MGWLTELAQRQRVPLAISLLVIFPILTYYLSTTLFFRKINRKGSKKAPPTVPYWIPGVYHAVGLISRPSTYFATYVNEYGNHGPCIVKAGRLSYTIVRDSNHVQRILDAMGQLTTNFERAEVYDKVLGTPKPTIECYRRHATKSEESDQINIAHFDLPQRYLTGPALHLLADKYIAIFRHNMSNKMFQIDSWTQIEDLWSFFQIEITRATTEMLFGSTLLKQYPKVSQDFWKLEANTEHFLPGLPRFTVSSVYDVRDRLLEGLKKWLQATHGGTDFAKIDEDDPVWDENKGSKFIQERDGIFSEMPSFNYKSRAAEILNVMQSSNSTTMPSTFWCVVEVLRNPDLAKYLKSEIARYYNPESGTYNIDAITRIPIIESIDAEIGRLRMATRTIRTNEGDSLELDDSWAIPKGTSVIMFSHDLGLNTEQWAKARPQTVARPLEEFWAERFLVSDKTSSTRQSKRHRDCISTGTFSLEGLASLNIPFGGGPSSLPTRSLAKAVEAATLAVLLTEFEVQLCEPDYVDHIVPCIREVAYGTVKPLDKIAIRLRKRRPGEKLK
ncbi:cytochrome P450 [Lentithecium fluviatile CBS 122367]|uniref:Cytochrome P450 n=1 Tax=Lentithecium fluviatile CBS 122367 TaxID=1168545 RepID=A0A6G1J9M6_9PLEO|nr:cytochrome P450 [Lentithecium fluviatile CBS 122367]